MNRRILIVDDDPTIGQLLTYQLREAGFSPAYESDPRRALQHLSVEPPDLLLLDAIMPSINGWELCSQIRRISDLPIIMVTARHEDSDVISGLRAGADDYVLKPFSTAQLLARIEAVLRRSRPLEKEVGAPARSDSDRPTRRLAELELSSSDSNFRDTEIITTPLSMNQLPSVEPAAEPDEAQASTLPASPNTRPPASVDPCAIPPPPITSEPPPPASQRSLGAYLRSRRVARGISLYQAERECHVRWEYLQALELNNFTFMPRPELRRALQTYATYLEADISGWSGRRQPAIATRIPPSAPIAALALAVVFVLMLSVYLF